ncbi:MAG: hypothetical protein KAR40_08030 [Candidatus Sabulitectum sp.]|nr:hypothetical protein [Candidatus Sabulitectum sp.]
MADTNVSYDYRDQRSSDRTVKTLCFICAVQKAMKCDPKVEHIALASENIDHCQCDICGEFIDDKVTI